MCVTHVVNYLNKIRISKKKTFEKGKNRNSKKKTFEKEKNEFRKKKKNFSVR